MSDCPIPEGQECPTCMRRVPKAKKPSSPNESKPLQFGRAPSDLVDEMKERVEGLAKSAGLASLAYPQARGIMLALELAESVTPEILVEVAKGMSWGRGS